MARRQWLQFGPLKGQNSSENPLALDAAWASRTSNVILDPESAVTVKRSGSRVITTPTGTYLLARFKGPQVTEGNAQLFAFAMNPTLQVWARTGEGAFNSVFVPAELTKVLRAVTLNGKLFFAAYTTINRMFCYEPVNGIRPVGEIPGTDPPQGVVDSTVTTLPPLARTYKQSWIRRHSVSGVITSETELSVASTVVTNNNLGSVLVTKSFFTGNPIMSHWVLWGSYDGVIYHKLTELPQATNTYLDKADPRAYPGDIAPEVGTFLPPPSVTRLITDGHRLIMSGNGSGLQVAARGETVPRYNRLWYTPVLGSSDHADDERIPQTSTQRNYIDLGENSNDGTMSELAGPIDGEIYAFTRRRIWRLVPTGDITTPYLNYPVSDRYGAEIGATAVEVTAVNGEDHLGRPCIYFLADSGGIHRLATGRVELVSFDIEQEVRASDRLHAFLLSVPAKRQLWYCTGGTSGPCRIRVFHWGQGRPDEDGDVRGGWVTWDIAGRVTGFQSGVKHNRSPGTDDCQCQEIVPHLVGYGTAEPISIFDRPEAIDNTTPYAASVSFAPWIATRGEKQFRVGNPVIVVTSSATPFSIAIEAQRDFNEVRTAQVSLVPLPQEGNPAELIRTVEGLFTGDATTLAITVRDVAATSAVWRVDWLTVPLSEQEIR